jgi:aryl-alcohol dehydrogenase-like predicted oxidoreductase
MKKIILGATGLEVSDMCLGTMMFGTTVDEKSALSVLDAYFENGGNFIDTSNNYAHWAGTGDESETLLGKWLAGHKADRDKLVIATKVGYDRHGLCKGLHRGNIEYWIDESLRKLGTDYVDLYYAHVDDFSTPLEETMDTLNDLVKKGKVRAIGCSNYYTWRMEKANEYCRRTGKMPFIVNQQKYSYLFTENGCEKELPLNEAAAPEKTSYLASEGIPLVAYSCLLGGGYEDNSRLPDHYVKKGRLAALNEVAEILGEKPSNVALAYMLNAHRIKGMPRIVPLFSTSKPDHLVGNLKASDIFLSDELLHKLHKA